MRVLLRSVVLVNFDTPFLSGHDGEGLCGHQRGWTVTVDDLGKLPLANNMTFGAFIRKIEDANFPPR